MSFRVKATLICTYLWTAIVTLFLLLDEVRLNKFESEMDQTKDILILQSKMDDAFIEEMNHLENKRPGTNQSWPSFRPDGGMSL